MILGKLIGEVVVTGGSRSGKTASSQIIKQWGADKGIRVLYVPEAASIVILSGVMDIGTIAENDPDLHFQVEAGMYAVQEGLREYVHTVGTHFPEDVLAVYDRGEIDIAAYMGKPALSAYIADHLGSSYKRVRDSYDMVLHLESTAVALPDQYSNANNPARYETVEQAIESDAKVYEAWSGHPNHKVFKCQETFAQKMNNVIEELERFINVH